MPLDGLSVDDPRDRGFPRRFGDYELIAEIARGSMGVVYEAHDRLANRRVALKTMLAGQRKDPVRVERFLREARQAAAIQHENVVCVYRVGELDRAPYFAMALVDGENLEDLAVDGPMSPRRAAEIGLSIARALEAAHSVGLVHRDIKPGNVLIDADGTVRVTDFGVAKMVDDDSTLTVDGEVFGSPSYMAPEQAMPSAYTEIGPAADVYGVGAVLYRLLAGRPPLVGSSSVGTMNLVLEQEPVALDRVAPGVPKALATIVHQCLQKSPKRRYADGGHLAADLKRFLAGEPVEARPVGRLERIGMWARREPGEAAMAAALVLAVIIGVGGIAWQWLDATAALQRAQREEAAARESRLSALATGRVTELPMLWGQVSGDVAGLRALLDRTDDPRVRLRAAVALMSEDPEQAGSVATLMPKMFDTPVEISMATRRLRAAWSGLPPRSRTEVLDRLIAPIDRAVSPQTQVEGADRDQVVGEAGAASAVLAVLAPEQLESRPEVAEQLIEMLLAVGPEKLRIWRRLAPRLPEPSLQWLVAEAKKPTGPLDATATERQRRQRAATLVVGFAGANFDAVLEVLLDAPPERLLELLREARLAWRRADVDPEPFWSRVRSVALQAEPIEAAARSIPAGKPLPESASAIGKELAELGGAIGPWGAFVPRAPAGAVARWSKELAEYGCHLVRARWVDDDSRLAAMWRFGAPAAEWRFDLGLAQLRAEVGGHQTKGLSLIDLSVMGGRAAAVWAEPEPGFTAKVAMKVGATVDRLLPAMRRISRYATPMSWRVSGALDAERFCVAWSLVDEPPVMRSLLAVPRADLIAGPLPGYSMRDVSIRVVDGKAVFDGLWSADPELESRVACASDSAEHRSVAVELAEAGWRPVSIHASPGDDGRGAAIASVWQRAVPPIERSFVHQETRLRAVAMLLAEDDVDTAAKALECGSSLTWRSRVMGRMSRFGLEVGPFIRWLDRIEQPLHRRVVLGICRKVGLGALPEAQRAEWIRARRAELAACTNRGLRAMLEWVLQEVGPVPAPAIAVENGASDQPGELRTADGRRLLVFEPGAFVMGAHGRQPGRATDATPHRVVLTRRFALAQRETTNRDMHEFYRQWPTFRNRKLEDSDAAASGVNWLQAAAYCRWLSEQEGIPESEQCYPPLTELARWDCTVTEGALDRTGYRLPSEAEWEFAARGQEAARFSFGDDVALYPDFAWGPRNTYAERPTGLFPPSERGLFDTDGNVVEWCHGVFQRTDWKPRKFEGFKPFDLERGAAFKLDSGVVCAMRGGSFGVLASHQSVTRRSAYLATGLAQGTGFRIARTIR